MAEIKDHDSLGRAAAEARARHERLREQRRHDLTVAIEAALDRGADDIAAVLSSLSRRDRDDLIEVFPQLFAKLSRTSSADEMRAVMIGVRALRRTASADPSARSAAIVRLSRAALATASVDPDHRPQLADKLREIDEAPGPRQLSWLWLGYRIRAGLAALRRTFALKP